MIFYNMPTNKNGNMTYQLYIDSILESVVKPWLEAGNEFVLEKDGMVQDERILFANGRKTMA